MNEAEPLIRLGRDNSSHKKAIVFIHGIGTRDPQEYWKRFTDVLLPDTHQLVEDFDVFVWGYPTHKWPSWSENLLQFLRNRTLIDASPAIERLGCLWRATYAVCHGHEIITHQKCNKRMFFRLKECDIVVFLMRLCVSSVKS